MMKKFAQWIKDNWFSIVLGLAILFYVIFGSVKYFSYDATRADYFWDGFFQNFMSDLILGVALGIFYVDYTSRSDKEQEKKEYRDNAIKIINISITNLMHNIKRKKDSLNKNQLELPFLHLVAWGKLNTEKGFDKDDLLLIAKLDYLFSFVRTIAIVEEEFYKILKKDEEELEGYYMDYLEQGYNRVGELINDINEKYPEIKIVENVLDE